MVLLWSVVVGVVDVEGRGKGRAAVTHATSPSHRIPSSSIRSSPSVSITSISSCCWWANK